MRKMFVEGLFNSVQKLERFTILEVPSQIVSDIVDIVAAATRMGTQVKWIDSIIDAIVRKREHYNLIQEAQNLEKKIEQLDCETKEAFRRFKEIYIELVYKDYGILTVYNYRIRVIGRPEWSFFCNAF